MIHSNYRDEFPIETHDTITEGETAANPLIIIAVCLAVGYVIGSIS